MSLPHPSRLVVHTSVSPPHVSAPQKCPHGNACASLTRMHTLHMYIHAYTRLHMPYTHTQDIHIHHFCACLGEPRPHTVYPPTFPMPLTCQPPCAHSPASFTSLLSLPPATWAQFGLTCACTSHRDMDAWPTTVDSHRAHTSPCSHTSSAHIASPPGFSPRGCVTVGLVGCCGVLITQTPSAMQPHCPRFSHGLAKVTAHTGTGVSQRPTVG